MTRRSSRRLQQKKRRVSQLEHLDPRVVLDGAGFATPVFYEPTPYLSEADTPAAFQLDVDCDDCVRGLETFEDNQLSFGLTIDGGQIVEPGFSTGIENLTDSVDGDDGVIDGTGQTNQGGHAYFTFGNTLTVTMPSLMQSAGLVWTDGDPALTNVIFEAFDQDGNSLGTKEAGDIADDSFKGTTPEDRFFGVSFGDGKTTGVTAIKITNVGGTGLEIDHIQFANCSECCDIDLELTKTVDTAVAEAGDLVNWTLTLTNNADNATDDATGVQVRDALPAGVTLVSATPSVGSFIPGTGVWTLNDPLSPGESQTLTLQTRLNAGLGAGTRIINVAQVTAANEDDVDSTPNNDDGDQSEDDEARAIVTVGGVIDLELTKTADRTEAQPGDTVNWTVTLTNNAQNATTSATGLAVLDVLPAGLTLVNATPSGAGAFTNGAWSVLTTLAPGESATLKLETVVDANVAPGTALTNTAFLAIASGNDVDSTPGTADLTEDDADSATVTVPAEQEVVDLELTKTADRAVAEAGDTINWTITLTNNAATATGDATGLAVFDVLPAGLTVVNATPSGAGSYANGAWSVLTTLAPGESATLQLETLVDNNVAPGTVLTNTAFLAAADGTDIDSTPGTADLTEDDADSASVTVPAVEEVIDLEVTKSVDRNLVEAGDAVTWTIVVTNNDANANTTATNVTLQDVMPAGVTLVSALPSNGFFNPSTGVWTVGALAEGATATLTLQTTVGSGLAGGSQLINTAFVATAQQNDVDSTPGDGNLAEDDADNAVVTVREQIDLELTKSTASNVVQAGDLVNWTITLTNNAANANADATGVVVEDLLPAGLTLVSATPSGNSSFAAGRWTINEAVSPGEVLTLSLQTRVNDGLTVDALTNVAQVVAADQADVDSAVNNDDGDQSEDDEDRAAITLETPAELLSLSGHAYVDVNNDGHFQSRELPLMGVEIRLTGTDINGDAVSRTTFTNVSGAYTFNDLLPGTYMVEEVQPVQFVDGKDTLGNLGGDDSVNDKFTVTLTDQDGVQYDFGELGLRPEYVNKRLYLTTTPYNAWQSIDVRQSSIWHSFNAAHRGFLDLHAAAGSGNTMIQVFDANMNLLGSLDPSDASNARFTLPESGEYYLRVSGDGVLDSLRLNHSRPQVSIADGVVTAVGTQGNDMVSLTLGETRHVLSFGGLSYPFDASEVNTIHIGASAGDDQVTVQGTAADETARLIGERGTLTGDGITVETYSFDRTTFVGGGGNDTAQLFGSLDADRLRALPGEVTLTTPDNVLRADGFDRVDAYGRAGDDYAQLFGTDSDDLYFARDEYALLKGGGYTAYTNGFTRVDAFGRGGDDTAKLYDSAGDDMYVATPEYAYLKNAERTSYTKGFERTEAHATLGGTDRAYFYDLAGSDDQFVSRSQYAYMTGAGYLNYANNFGIRQATSSGDNDVARLDELKTGDVFQAADAVAQLNAMNRMDRVTGFARVELTAADDSQQPTRDVDGSLDFVLAETLNWL